MISTMLNRINSAQHAKVLASYKVGTKPHKGYSAERNEFGIRIFASAFCNIIQMARGRGVIVHDFDINVYIQIA